MALFTRDSIDRLREAVDMVDLVGAKTDLRRVGSRWSGLCPFHDERTPSFSVDPAKKLYHCFGCGEGGDAISFVRQTEALEFPEAVELLAERYNVRVDRVEDDPPPAMVPGATEPERVVDYLAGMTDRFAIRAFAELSLPQGF